MEQFVRDSRINQVYEGANGVQALDLVGRKMTAKGGRATLAFFGVIEDFIKENEGNADLAFVVGPMKKAYADAGAAAGWLMENGPKDPNNAGAASYDVLTMFGILSVGLMWGRMAKVAQGKIAAGDGNADFYKRKLTLAKYWMEREMPMTASLLARLQAGADTIMELDAANF